MKQLALILSILFIPILGRSQVVVTEPEFSTENDSIKITFDASLGDMGLMGYTGPVYAHTGVITNLSGTNWAHVVGSWGDNSAQPALTSIGQNKYELVIGFPRQFYNLTNPAEKILKFTFVFRSGDQSVTGRDVGGADIFVDLYEAGMSLVLESPQLSTQFGLAERSPVFANLGDNIQVKIGAAEIGTQVDSIALAVNGNETSKVAGNSLSFDFVASNYPAGLNQLQAIGTDTTGIMDTITFSIMVNALQPNTPPPAGTIPGINYLSDTSVTLALFAPYKEFVYVVGDFNDWKVDANFYMHKYQVSADSVLWWTNISGLTPGQEYAFQYLIDGELRIADPYTEKILDPWNDGFIPAITYPNLKPYPQGKTAEPTSVLQTAQTPYNWVHSDNFQAPPQEELVIYELLIRDFVAAHDYATLIDTLDYLEKLGVNAIGLMPFNEFEGNSSWGYNTSFYFAPDKYYGTEKALKSFIDECHRRGIAVIMDIVLNHSYGQAPLVRMYWDGTNNRPAANNPWFNQVSPNQVFSFGFDFDHESPHTEAFVDRVNRYWIEEYKIDGYRFDFTKGFTNTPGDGGGYDQSRIDILKRMADEVWTVDADAYVILEHFAPNNEEKILAEYNQGMMIWGNSNFNYNEATMGYHNNGGSDFSWAYFGSRGWSKAHLVSYMESHDEERLMFKNLEFGNSSGDYSVKDLSTALERTKLAAAFYLTYPGPKMIWQFGELGYDVSIDDPCRVCEKPISWNYYSDPDRLKVYKTYQALLKLRAENEVFRDPSANVTLWLNSPGGEKRIKMSHSSMNVSIIGNFDVVDKDIAPQFLHPGMWYNYFKGDSLNVTDLNQSFTLSPGSFHIWTDVKLQTPEPDILLSNAELRSDLIPLSASLHPAYPNPFSGEISIVYDLPNREKLDLAIYDLHGRKMIQLVDEQQSAGQYQLKWDGKNESNTQLASGMYMIRMQVGDAIQTQRILFK